MSASSPTPVVGVVCNYNAEDPERPSHRVADKYVGAVAEAAGALPLLLPALGEAADVEALLDRLDGVLLTGGVSNVEPHRFGGPPSRPGTPHDPARDGLTLRLIRAAVAGGVPLFGICRGLQEMNVAFGGSLHQHLHEVPGRMDHRRPREKPVAEQYGPRHTVRLARGGLLARLAGAETVPVNSLHGQGIDRLGEGLAVEAVAEDGTIEAVRVEGAGFALGVQWHPEYRALATPFYAALFQAFGNAARAYAAEHRSHGRNRRVA